MVSAKLFLISVYGFAATAAIGVAPPTMAVMMPASGVAAVSKKKIIIVFFKLKR